MAWQTYLIYVLVKVINYIFHILLTVIISFEAKNMGVATTSTMYYIKEPK